MMIVKNYKHFVSTTLVAAASGLVLAMAYMATNQQDDAYWLVIGQFVAMACAMGWLLNMAWFLLPLLLRSLKRAVAGLLSKNYFSKNTADWEMVRIRRDMVAKRISKYDQTINTVDEE